MKISTKKLLIMALVFYIYSEKSHCQVLNKFRSLRYSVGIDSTLLLLGNEISSYDFSDSHQVQIAKLTEFIDVLNFLKTEKDILNKNQNHDDIHSKKKINYWSHYIFKEAYDGWFFILHFYRSDSKYNIGDFYGSISDFNEIKTFTNNKEFHKAAYLAACAYFQLGNTPLGCNLLSEAGQRGSSKAYELMSQFCK